MINKIERNTMPFNIYEMESKINEIIDVVNNQNENILYNKMIEELKQENEELKKITEHINCDNCGNLKDGVCQIQNNCVKNGHKDFVLKSFPEMKQDYIDVVFEVLNSILCYENYKPQNQHDVIDTLSKLLFFLRGLNK